MTPDVTLRFERRLQHPIQRVWAAITEPDEIEAWWGRATVDLRPGGAMRIEWLNSDVTMPATITELDPPHVLEIEGEPHGRLRFELEPDGDGTRLHFEHSGFDVSLPYGEQAFKGAGYGWATMHEKLVAIVAAKA